MTVQALRELTRTRKQLTRERASHVQRIDKVLQAANLKLGSLLPTSWAGADGPFWTRSRPAKAIRSDWLI